MTNCIEIFYKKSKFDVVSKAKLKDIEAAGYNTNFKFQTEHIYKLSNDLTTEDLHKIALELLVDPIIQNFQINTDLHSERYNHSFIVDIWLKNGVTDTTGETIEKSIETLGIKVKEHVKTGIRYLIDGTLDKKLAQEIVEKILMNQVIQECEIRKVS